MTYKVVFDIVESGYKSWSFPAFGLIFIAIGLFLVIFRKLISGWWGNHPRARDTFSSFFLWFAVIWTLISFFGTYSEYSNLRSAYKSGNFDVVEGRVTYFMPMPYSGHAMEKFCVNDHCFEYSDFVVSGSFNNTMSHGGPIREGLPVRVTFVRNKIIKLEVAL
jgi:hypothetical protein